VSGPRREHRTVADLAAEAQKCIDVAGLRSAELRTYLECAQDGDLAAIARTVVPLRPRPRE
jgi:hypothetical protein